MSRELDAEVAATVFDWVWAEPIHLGQGEMTRRKWLMRREDMNPKPAGYPHKTDEWREAGGDTPRAGNWDHLVPRYSTDIAAAWLVVERMREQGYAFEIDDQRRYGGDGLEVNFVALGDEPRRDGWATHVSMPRAICDAALAAHGPDAVETGGEDGD